MYKNGILRHKFISFTHIILMLICTYYMRLLCFYLLARCIALFHFVTFSVWWENLFGSWYSFHCTTATNKLTACTLYSNYFLIWHLRTTLLPYSAA